MTSAAHACGICELRHVTKPTVAWCPECDEGFCLGCEEHHSLARASRHHKTIPIAEYLKLPTDVLQIPQSCSKHDEKFILYCKDPELPCCGKCAIEVHKGCNEVVNLDDIIKNAKTSTSFTEIEETLVEVVDNIKEITKLYRGNMTSLSENRKQIEKQFQEIRFKIDTHLNKIHKNLVDELQEVEVTEKRKVSQLVKTLEDKENNLTKYQNLISNIKHHASDLQTFMSIKQIEKDLANEEEFCQSCLDGDKVNTTVITSSIDESVETIMENVQQFGEIAVVLKSTKAALRERKKKQAQIVIPKIRTKTIENITARLQDTINITSEDVIGCCILPDCRIAFTCHKRNMLILIKSDGSKDFEIAIPGAVDVANGSTDTTVIVSSCELFKSGISIVDIQDRKIRKVIPVHSGCYGLIERNGHVIFCTDSGLRMFNLQTETIITITTEGVYIFPYVDTNGENIYYTFDHSVRCCDFQGDIKWTFRDTSTLITPSGISVDDDGFSFFISNNSVMLISPCGKDHRTLISYSDGVSGAQALHYDKTRDILLVIDRKEKAFLYKIDRK